jgi:hypothetical protein
MEAALTVENTAALQTGKAGDAAVSLAVASIGSTLAKAPATNK